MHPSEGNERRDRIFDVIVRSYIETAEPVASRMISRRSDLGLSSASIRNVMADLEEQGLLAQPHTSAGRVPTDKGYRYWVDCLMQPEELAEDEKREAVRQLEAVRNVGVMAERVSRMLSELTDNAALVFIKNLRRGSFLAELGEKLAEAERLMEAMEQENGVFIDGAFRVCDQPEFRDARKLKTLLQAFDDKRQFVRVIVRDLGEEGLHVHIGRESAEDELADLSVVVKDCYLAGRPIGSVAVVGPKRMNYSKVVSVVDFIADTVSERVARY
jgi:transcriptional regulator of heat shock response